MRTKKITVELPDALHRTVRAAAAERGVTLGSLVVEGLRRVVAGRRNSSGPFRLRDASFGGRGLRPGMREGDWATVRSLVHERRDA